LRDPQRTLTLLVPDYSIDVPQQLTGAAHSAGASGYDQWNITWQNDSVDRYETGVFDESTTAVPPFNYQGTHPNNYRYHHAYFGVMHLATSSGTKEIAIEINLSPVDGNYAWNPTRYWQTVFFHYGDRANYLSGTLKELGQVGFSLARDFQPPDALPFTYNVARYYPDPLVLWSYRCWAGTPWSCEMHGERTHYIWSEDEGVAYPQTTAMHSRLVFAYHLLP
jgi:hypothetical protein